MAIIKFNNNSIYFEEHGKGNPLILIAGLGSDSQSWLPVVDKLTKHFRVITFDNRGLGRSAQDNSGITIKKMTDDCVELIRHLKLSSVYILGHSMGGMIALDLAIRYPEMVDKLILEATAPKLNKRNTELFYDWVLYLKSGMEKYLWFKNIFYWIFSPEFFENNGMLTQAVNMAVEYPYPQSDVSFENQFNAISIYNCISEINKIQAPTLIINGEIDMLFPSSETAELFKYITQAQTIIIPKAAHSIHMENPEDFSNNVISFCNQT